MNQMKRLGRAEQATDGNVEAVFVRLAGVVVFAVLSEDVWRDGVRASGIMCCQRGEEGR